MADGLSTTFSVSSQSELNADIEQLYSAAAGDYTINFTGDIVEGQESGQPAGIYAIDLPQGVTLTINGDGHALNGNGEDGGLAVLAGKVTIESLTIEDTVAQGGAGAASGGGGAGLGGGLFVGPGAAVTLAAVTFSNDSAKGGAGGPGGGGGAGGHSSLIVPLGAAGHGGVAGTNGSNGALPGSPGIPGGSGSAGGSGGFGQPGGRGGNGGAGGNGRAGPTGGTGGSGGVGASGGRGGIGGTGGAAGDGGKGGNAGTSTALSAQGSRGGHGGSGARGGTGGFGGGGGAGGTGGDAGKGGNKASLLERSGTGGTGGPGGPGGLGGFGGGGGGGGDGGKGGAAGTSAGAGGPGGSGGAGGKAGFGGGGGGGGLGGAPGTGSGKLPGGGTPHSGAGGAGAAGSAGGGHGANGSQGGAGGGGLGAGGDIFVAAGGALTVDGGLIKLNGGSVSGGASASQKGSAEGAGAFIGGGLTLQAGTLSLTSASAAGTGAIVFETGHTSTLQFTSASAPSNPIEQFIKGDTIEIKGFAATNHGYTNGVLTVSEPGKTISLDMPGRTPLQFQFGIIDSNTVITSNAPPCYREGTRIAAERGQVAVEALAVGDRVRTRDGSCHPIVWIGRRRIDCRRHKEPSLVWPVRVLAGAVSNGVPRRDLFLSPDHAILADDVLIPVKHLINGATIVQVPSHEVVYYHIELAHHDVLLAEGLPAESYLDTGNRHLFANGGKTMSLHPEFVASKSWPHDAAAPLATDEVRVKPVWQRLAARSRALGMPVPEPAFTDDPALRLQIGGHMIRPTLVRDNRYMFCLPRHTGVARLLSRVGRPSDRKPWIDDWRCLGVYVGRIVAHDHDGPADVALDHPSLLEGWWAIERAGLLVRRWTNGGASLAISPAATLLEIHLAGTISYRTDVADAGVERKRAAA